MQQMIPVQIVSDKTEIGPVLKHQESSRIFKNYLDMAVWQLRHLQISNLIEKYGITKILDIGCAQGTLLNRLSRSCLITKLIGVDMDESVLRTAKSNICPELIQESVGFQRKQPLQIELYLCDALVGLPIGQIRDVELVTMVEFIEHIPLESLPLLNEEVFKVLRPQFVAVTTPNQEFNVHFNFTLGQMRHPGHLFQWTRPQFKQYCHNIEQKYGYSFQLFDIGQHINHDQYGSCSQGAFFIKNKKIEQMVINTVKSQKIQPYIYYRYPFWKDRIKQRIQNELCSLVYRFNYSQPKQIIDRFHNSKIGLKLSQQNNKQKYNQKWVIKSVKNIRFCGYDEERNELFYEYVNEQQQQQIEDINNDVPIQKYIQGQDLNSNVDSDPIKQ